MTPIPDFKVRHQLSSARIDKPAILLAAIDCSPAPVSIFRKIFACQVRRVELAIPTAQCRGPSVKNIFVGNLSFNTNEDELRQMFEAYGQVDRVSIMTDRDTGRSRGFGFVEMTNNEDGEKAIAALNGSQVGGRTLNVNEARPKAERSGGGFRDRGDRGGRGGGRRDRY